MSNKEFTKEVAPYVAIATTTFYNPDDEADNIRANLACEMVRNACGSGYEIFVVDGGSSDDFLQELQRYGAKIYSQEQKSMGAGRRQSIRAAYDTNKEVIAWTEPEKKDYVKSICYTVVPILAHKAKMVIPERKSLESYPLAQQYAEKFGNIFWHQITDTKLDMWFGPRTFSRELVECFLKYDGIYGDRWDSIFIPVMDIVFDNPRDVIGIEIDYTHPWNQKMIEDMNSYFTKKRLDQLNNLMPAIKDHWADLSRKAAQIL